MPPIRAQKRQKSPGQEGRVLLAIKAIKNEEVTSGRKAADIYTVPETTIRKRRASGTYRSETRANSHKLTQEEEDSLTEWMFSIDARGVAPRPATVGEMTNILREARGASPALTAGENWASNFVKRRPELHTRYSRQYNY